MYVYFNKKDGEIFSTRWNKVNFKQRGELGKDYDVIEVPNYDWSNLYRVDLKTNKLVVVNLEPEPEPVPEEPKENSTPVKPKKEK